MGLFASLFGNKSKKVQDFISRNAVIIDVRSVAEYSGGAIPGSKNIPLQQLSDHISEIKNWNKPVICCCASGIRSGSASTLLRKHDIDAVNGGGWASLKSRI